MGVRRRAVRERVQRDRKRREQLAAFDASLARLKRVIDEALAEGLTKLSNEEFCRRLTANDAADEQRKS